MHRLLSLFLLLLGLCPTARGDEHEFSPMNPFTDPTAASDGTTPTKPSSDQAATPDVTHRRDSSKVFTDHADDASSNPHYLSSDPSTPIYLSDHEDSYTARRREAQKGADMPSDPTDAIKQRVKDELVFSYQASNEDKTALSTFVYTPITAARKLVGHVVDYFFPGSSGNRGDNPMVFSDESREGGKRRESSCGEDEKIVACSQKNCVEDSNVCGQMCQAESTCERAGFNRGNYCYPSAAPISDFYQKWGVCRYMHTGSLETPPQLFWVDDTTTGPECGLVSGLKCAVEGVPYNDAEEAVPCPPVPEGSRPSSGRAVGNTAYLLICNTVNDWFSVDGGTTLYPCGSDRTCTEEVPGGISTCRRTPVSSETCADWRKEHDNKWAPLCGAWEGMSDDDELEQCTKSTGPEIQNGDTVLYPCNQADGHYCRTHDYPEDTTDAFCYHYTWIEGTAAYAPLCGRNDDMDTGVLVQCRPGIPAIDNDGAFRLPCDTSSHCRRYDVDFKWYCYHNDWALGNWVTPRNREDTPASLNLTEQEFSSSTSEQRDQAYLATYVGGGKWSWKCPDTTLVAEVKWARYCGKILDENVYVQCEGDRDDTEFISALWAADDVPTEYQYGNTAYKTRKMTDGVVTWPCNFKSKCRSCTNGKKYCIPDTYGDGATPQSDCQPNPCLQ